MISFRYHIVSIVSVFLALAIGIALGGGPLKGEVDNSLVKQVAADRERKAKLQSEISELHLVARFNGSFAQTVAPGLLRGKLASRPISVVVLPGASDVAVTATTEFVKQAGGSIAGTYRVGDDLVNPAQKQLVDELGSQLLDGTKDVTVPDGATGYDRMGALIARAIGTEIDAGAPLDESSGGILSGLDTAGLMSSAGDPVTRGSLVLVVAGEGQADTPEQQAQNSILTALLTAVDAHTDGVVVAGPVSSASRNGLVDAIQNDVAAARDVSTVDSVTGTTGQLVAVLALAEQAAGNTGHYGAVDAPDGAMPGALAGEDSTKSQ